MGAPRTAVATRPSTAARLARRLAATGLTLLVVACAGDSTDTTSSSSTEPWGSHTVSPADLVKELSAVDKPVIVCTAPPSMYRMAHIAAAVLHGPASSPGPLNELTAWAKGLPRTTSLVIYCGCCPLAYCPNLRPAYNALKDMGFKNLRVLILAENFGTDWVDRGYPVER